MRGTISKELNVIVQAWISMETLWLSVRTLKQTKGNDGVWRMAQLLTCLPHKHQELGVIDP